MIVEYSLDGGLRLAEPDDFRKFKLLLKGSFETPRPDIEGVVFVDDDNALVGVELVPALAGVPAGTEWRGGYDKMVDAAARHGWIDPASNAIRAHVERLG